MSALKPYPAALLLLRIFAFGLASLAAGGMAFLVSALQAVDIALASLLIVALLVFALLPRCYLRIAGTRSVVLGLAATALAASAYSMYFVVGVYRTTNVGLLATQLLAISVLGVMFAEAYASKKATAV
jgi:hypothetical protein